MRGHGDEGTRIAPYTTPLYRGIYALALFLGSSNSCYRKIFSWHLFSGPNENCHLEPRACTAPVRES